MKNDRRNNFMTKSSRKDGPDARTDRGVSLFPSDIATDRAIAPGSIVSNDIDSIQQSDHFPREVPPPREQVLMTISLVVDPICSSKPHRRQRLEIKLC